MHEKLQRITALAKIIFLDGLRRHALIGLILLALLAELFGLIFVDFFGHDLGRATSDFLFSTMWITGMIFLFFHAVQVIAWDEEHKVIFGIISRPISRNEYLLGVALGLISLLAVLQLVLGGIAYGSLIWLQANLSISYFDAFNSFGFVLTWLGLLLSQSVILSAILLFSGIVRGGFAVLILSVAYYFICSGLPVAREHIAHQVALGKGGEGAASIFTILTLLFPDLNRMDFKNEVLTQALTIPLSDVAIQSALAGAYIILTMLLACYAYGRRDIQ